MPRFNVAPPANPPVHAPHWAAGDAVQLRPYRTWTMVVRAEDKANRLPPGTTRRQLQKMGAEQADAYILNNRDSVALHQSLLGEMIVSWSGPSFTYPDGSPVPVTAETIAQLDEDDVLFLIEEINTRGASLRPDADDAAEQAEEDGAAQKEIPFRDAAGDAAEGADAHAHKRARTTGAASR